MPWLAIVGLGLYDDLGISLRGLEIAREADRVFIELYTSEMPGLDLDRLQRAIGKRIEILERSDLEEKAEEVVIKPAMTERICLLVPGDPFVATTHQAIRLRAIDLGIEVRIVHGSSVISAIPGLAGLQIYRFGRIATIPHPEKGYSRQPYLVLKSNLERGLHTLFLLDIVEGRAMEPSLALEILLKLESDIGDGILSDRMLCVVVGGAGSTRPLVRAGRIGDLMGEDLGDGPHSLVIPGKLHFLEQEALMKIGGASRSEIEEHERMVSKILS